MFALRARRELDGPRAVHHRNDLRSWFPSWKPLILRTIGQIDGQAPSWVYASARRVGDVWFDYWTDRCPKCGHAGLPRA